MASFVETATLKVIDESTSEIRKINRSLQGLFKTADKLKNKLGNVGQIRVDTRQVTNATRSLNNLSRASQRAGQNMNIRARVNITGIQQATTGMRGLTQQANAAQRAIMGLGRRGRINLPGLNVGPPQYQQGPAQQIPGLRSLFDGFLNRLGATIENAIVTGLAKGTRDVDLAQTRLNILGFDPATRERFNTNASNLANANTQFSRAQILAAMGEIAPSVNNDPENTRFVTNEVLQYSKALKAAGATADEATDNLQKLSKAMGIQSVMLDSRGNFDRNAVKDFMEVLIQETITGGREMTPELIAQLAKYSRTTGKTLNQEGLRTLLFLGEDYGSSAGVGLNQLVKQLTGERVQKQQLNRQMELGLVGSREIETGKTGGRRTTEIISTGPQNENLLRSDPAKWVRDILIPNMRKNGYDPTDNVQAAKYAGEITSDRTATDILTTMITNMGEIVQRADIAQRRGNVDLDRINENSLTSELDTTWTQFKSVLGETANSFKNVLIPVINATGDGLRNLANLVAGNGEGSMLAAGAVAGGGALGAYGLYKGLSGIAGGFGLAKSAVALDGSAAALTRAALALQGSATGTQLQKQGEAGKAQGVGGRGTFAFLNLLEAAWNAPSSRFDDSGRVVKPDWVDEFNKNAENLTPRAALDAMPEKDTMMAGLKKFFFGAAADPNFNFRTAMGVDVKAGGETTAVADLKQGIDTGAQAMQNAFTTGSQEFTVKSAEAASSFGLEAAAAISASAGAWGVAAASSLKQNIGDLTINVQPLATPDTGKNTNEVR